MERHRCKLCFRTFSNGRALGGHMRSHVINKQDQVQDIEQIHSCSSSQGEVEINREISIDVLQHCESESESSKSNIFGRRSKRARKKSRVFCSKKLSNSGEDQSPLMSSVSDTTAEEDVAHCLMMLSRDKWEKGNENDEDDEYSEDCGGGGGVVKVIKKDINKVRGKYRCETCNKLFKSYQALGGHRASYKKIKADVAARDSGSPPPPVEKVQHECPFCHRVFASGQALGGHKRSHFLGASNFTAFRKVSRIGENWNIDLNLPAPVDDGGEFNFSDQ